eukprot:CAMPEP_0197836188 /NCGR_PEP_ID=MMETSP1437-20131217/28210_1 /TAXON_ID=49252 ORGANISM="Eucampia antarctica, Strain CCMP1452" /NCGR_SAMPLE_ID=MMETSP1437 /ASSEMBLY_ACC=CAM_ASM_001096 /LENGTH=253 /DNA_ID=CAMNT_0043442175 /DNA_START=116 /DNA_END=877 /DNA_ORIENTATION=+
MPQIETVMDSDNNGDQQAHERSIFAADRHHLSEIGHKYVAEALVEVLSVHSSKPQALLGSWGGGDQCYFWMNSLGTFPADLKVEGGQLRQFDPFLQKWAYEVEEGSAAQLSFLKHETLPTVNDKNNEGEKNTDLNSVPIHLVYMAKESLYPSARVVVVNNFDTTKINNDAYKYIDFSRNNEENNRWQHHHITQSQVVGYSSEGVNTVVIDSVSKTERPLRIVGVMLCRACELWKNNVLEEFFMRLPEIKNINN